MMAKISKFLFSPFTFWIPIFAALFAVSYLLNLFVAHNESFNSSATIVAVGIMHSLQIHLKEDTFNAQGTAFFFLLIGLFFPFEYFVLDGYRSIMDGLIGYVIITGFTFALFFIYQFFDQYFPRELENSEGVNNESGS